MDYVRYWDQPDRKTRSHFLRGYLPGRPSQGGLWPHREEFDVSPVAYAIIEIAKAFYVEREKEKKLDEEYVIKKFKALTERLDDQQQIITSLGLYTPSTFPYEHYDDGLVANCESDVMAYIEENEELDPVIFAEQKGYALGLVFFTITKLKNDGKLEDVE